MISWYLHRRLLPALLNWSTYSSQVFFRGLNSLARDNIFLAAMISTWMEIRSRSMRLLSSMVQLMAVMRVSTSRLESPSSFSSAARGVLHSHGVTFRTLLMHARGFRDNVWTCLLWAVSHLARLHQMSTHLTISSSSGTTTLLLFCLSLKLRVLWLSLRISSSWQRSHYSLLPSLHWLPAHL